MAEVGRESRLNQTFPMKYLIRYNHSENEHAPDWLSMEIEAECELEARQLFEAKGQYASEFIIIEVD